MVVTLGFGNDPNLDLLDESNWRLLIDLDEEESLEQTSLEATSLRWTTLFLPPWFAPEIEPSGWLVMQWRADENGDERDRTRRRLSVQEPIEAIPRRFHDWVLTTTSEAAREMEGLVPELSAESGMDLDGGMAMLQRAAELRTEIEDAQAGQRQKARAKERIYGSVFIYDFDSETDLDWRIDLMPDGDQALFARPVEDSDDSCSRVFIPASEMLDWRWSSPVRPSDGGEYLSPSEVLGRVPRDFHGWVAAKTHEALQQVRHGLFLQSAGTIADAEDVAQVIRLSRHAQGLSGFSGVVGREVLELLDEGGEEAPIAHGLTPDGRLLLLPSRAWNHIVKGHPEMKDRVREVIESVEEPTFREPDLRPGRERFYRQTAPRIWMRVVVEVHGLVERIVTAFPQSNPPRQGRDS